MSNEAVDRQRLKINEFMHFLPLTLAIAGLPECELGRQFTEGQMEVRCNTIRTAFKMARQLLQEVAK